MFNIICVKFGNKYSSDFVNKLQMDCLTHLGNFDFYCYTDDPEGIHQSIQTINPVGPTLKGVWNKLCLFNPEFPIVGKNIFLDLDVCVKDNFLEHLTNHNWNNLHLVYAPWKDNKKKYGRLSSYDVTHHSSVMMWENNVHHIWNHFNSGLRDYYMRKYVGIDRFLAHEDFEIEYLPENMIMSKKYQNFNSPAIVTYEELDVSIQDLI